MPKKEEKEVLNSYYIDFNSFEVVAKNEEEAYDKAIKRMEEDTDLVRDFEVNLNERDVEDYD